MSLIGSCLTLHGYGIPIDFSNPKLHEFHLKNKYNFILLTFTFMEDLNKLKIKRNFVLIKPDKDHETVSLKGNNGQSYGEIYIESTNETEARHYSITGTVLKVPEKLTYRGRDIDKLRIRTGSTFNSDQAKDLAELVYGSMEYEVAMELKEGDKVWFDYIAQLSGETQKKKIEIEGHGTCLLIEYAQVFLYERDLKMYPANGWVWIKNIEASRDLGNGVILPDTVDVTLKGVAEVVRIGAPITHYMEARHNLKRVDVKPGMKIYYRPKSSTPIEYSMHMSNGLEGLRKVQLKDINAVLEAQATMN